MKIKYSYDDNDKLSIEIFLPKCRRSINIRNKRYFLSFPPIIFNIFVSSFGSVKAGVGYKIGSNIYHVNFPNTTEAYICLNNLNLTDLGIKSTSMFGQHKLDIDLFANKFINYFWNSKFTYAITNNLSKYCSKSIKSSDSFSSYLDKWQSKTLSNVNYFFRSKNLIFLCKEEDFEQKCLFQIGFYS